MITTPEVKLELTEEQKANYVWVMLHNGTRDISAHCSYVTLYITLQSQESGINLLSIRVPNPEKYALALMDALFQDADMAECCFMTSQRLPSHLWMKQKLH